MDIGKKIKDLRLSQSLTQEELAMRCELTKGFISQVERNNTSPSIATLIDILQSLGTNLHEFFSKDSDEQIVFSINDYFENVDKNGTKEWVIPNAQKNKLEPLRITLNSNSSTEVVKPSESEFFGYILKGAIQIHIGGKILSAKSGDSFYYRGKKEHYISTKKGATFLWISTPPIF